MTKGEAALYAAEYAAKLAGFNRSAGQWKRYVDIDFGSIIPAAPKRITQGSIRRLEKSIQEARRQYDVERAGQAEQARKKDLNEARLAVENVKATLEEVIEGTTEAYARIDVEFTVNAIKHMINQAIRRSGYKRVYDRLKDWATDFEDKLKKLARAIYSEYYNTNSNPFKRDRQGENGRSRFLEDFKELARVLKVNVPQEIVAMY